MATSDCWAPTAATSARARRLSETETHNYANFPGMAHGNHMNSDDKNFLPGIYAVSLQMFTRFKVAKDKISSYDSTHRRTTDALRYVLPPKKWRPFCSEQLQRQIIYQNARILKRN